MKIIIVENELHLAQSIASKLGEHNFETEIFSSTKDAMKANGDVYLLSTNMPGQNSDALIKTYKEKIIILMVNYINNDTVSIPLKLGAKDYIVKPFMIEELIRKIAHYQDFQELKMETKFYETYIDNLLKEIKIEENIDKISPPMVIETNYQRLIDKVVFHYAKENNKRITFIPLGKDGWKDEILNSPSNSLLYITEIHSLKKTDRLYLMELIKSYDFILCSTSEIESEFKTIRLDTDSKLYDQNEILTIDDYVKFIVNSFQYKFPDTELSKKLGISRKSLWEKRRKFNLFKKK